MTENISSIIWAMAWGELYRCFGEHLQEEELNLMDSVLQGVITQDQEDAEQREE